MDDKTISNHRQFYQFKFLVLLLALLALAALLSWVVSYGGVTARLRGLAGGPTATATLPTLSAAERVARTATAEAQATGAAGAAAAQATQTAERAVAMAQATATIEVQAVATHTTVAVLQATRTAEAMTAAEAAALTPTPLPTETPTPTPAPAAPTATEVTTEATPPPAGTPETVMTPGITPTPLPVEVSGEAATPEAAVAAAPQEFQYTVRYGDTLTGLARRFGTTVDDIVQRNDLADPDLIRAGQTLTIFGTPPAPPVDYVVQPGDTLWALAARFNTTVSVIARLNRIANPSRIWAGQTLRIVPGALVAPPDYLTYSVKPGDTLWAIALHYGTTPWAIAIVNNLPNPHLIFVGQVLQIP